LLLNKCMHKFLLTILLIFICSSCFAGINDFTLNRSNLIVLGPPVVNKDYYLIEFGFIIEKKIEEWHYNYNAFVSAALFEDWLDKSGGPRAGGLGFKAGVILPTNPWTPLLFSISTGFVKTVLNKNPLIGNESQNIQKKTMFLLEVGPLYRIDKYFLRYVYQVSNVKYFKRHAIIEFGVSY
jgi:hypothetical protein